MSGDKFGAYDFAPSDDPLADSGSDFFGEEHAYGEQAMKPWEETWHCEGPNVLVQDEANRSYVRCLHLCHINDVPRAQLAATAPELYRALDSLGRALVMGNREDIGIATRRAGEVLAKARGE